MFKDDIKAELGAQIWKVKWAVLGDSLVAGDGGWEAVRSDSRMLKGWVWF